MAGILDGKVVAITGAGRGIGREIALLCAREGAAVAIADVNLDGAKQAAEKLIETGARALPIPVDVADPASAQDYGEPAGPRMDAAYTREHAEIFTPMLRLFGLVREIGAAITHEVGAFG